MTKLEAASRLKATANVWRYAMVNRPVGIGCCPKEGLVGTEERPASGRDHHDMARNGVAVYDRKLTDHETKQFEMAFMADGADRDEEAAAVAASMARYARQVAELAAKRPKDFERSVHDSLKKVAKGYPPSVGDIEAFAALVLTHLKALT